MRTLPLVLLAVLAALPSRAEQPYQSPYQLKFTFPLKELVGDLDGPRGEAKKSSETPFSDWYSPALQRRFTTWGPSSKQFDRPPSLSGKPAEFLRQRVLATAMRYVGYRYQHHHLPDWDPPQDWPYSASPLGRQSKGVDCSNFTAWVYNLALGLKPTGETRAQSALTEVPGPGPGRTTKVERIERPATWADFPRVLKTGDLLFIKSRSRDEITHVVLWVGPLGEAPGHIPLILDSTGDGHKDSAGVPIPDGIHLRPFTEKSWYAQSASHALRFIPDASATR